MSVADQTLHPAAASDQEPPRLAKHRYPLPIVAAAVITLIAVGYSFVLAPGVVSASRDLQAGRDALHRGDYDVAVNRLKAAHDAAPSSHDVTLSLAEAEFASHDPVDAMALLDGVKLDQGDWDELTRYMPQEYQKYFEQA
jgi:hypothetical protein